MRLPAQPLCLEVWLVPSTSLLCNKNISLYSLLEGQTFGDPHYFPPCQRLLSCDAGTWFPDCHHRRKSGLQTTDTRGVRRGASVWLTGG